MVEKLSVEALIIQIGNSVHGELTSRGQVVDLLLDLRLAGADRAPVVETVDRLLAEMPGRTTVPNSWWLNALAEIERSARPVSVASAAPVAGAASDTAASATTASDTAASDTTVQRPRRVSSPPPLPRRRPSR